MKALALLLIALGLVERELGGLHLVAVWRDHGALPEWLRTVVLDFRLPRLVLGVLIGSGMAIAGWTIQKATRNPMAGPSTVSVTGAAALGVMLALTLSGGALLGARTLPLIASLSGVASAALLFGLFGRARRMDGSGLLLAGIALGALWGAIGFALALAAHDSTYQFAVAWLYGSLSKANWDYVWLLFPTWWLLALAIHKLAPRVQVLALEDDVVASLGGRPEAWRRGALCGGAALASACIGVGGSFAFLGFLSPALVRTLAPHTFHTPFSSAVAGVLLLLTADVLGRAVAPPAEVPAGIVIAVVGAPLFVVGLILWKRVRPA